MRNPPQDDFRGGEHLHVSDLIHKCTRMIALSERLNLPIRGDRIMDSRAITFATGHAIQGVVTDRLKANMSDLLWGNWTCVCGYETIESKTYEEVRNEKECEYCHTAPHRYVETTWISEELKLSGSIDIMLKLGDGFYPIEVKSAAGRIWEDLTRPIPDHLIQALFYYHLARENNLPLMDQLSILYVKKEFIFGNPYKEFLVTPSNYLHRLEDFLDEARELKAFRHDNGPLPVRTSCMNELSPAARECPFALQCFAIDPPREGNR